MSLQISPEEFNEQIGNRMAGAPVPAEEINLFTDVSNAAVRPAGGYVTGCTLEGKPVLYRPASEDLGTANLTAGHAMLPVGQHDEFGHNGVPRWIDYVRNNRTDTYSREVISLVGITPPGYAKLSRHFRLNHVGFSISTVIDNMDGSRDLDTSIGERLYLDYKDEDPKGMLINGMTLDHVFGEGAADRIMDGHAEFWPGLFMAEITFSSGKQMNVGSTLVPTPTRKGINNARLAGMFFWHHRDTDSLCVEPTFGVAYAREGDLRNNNLSLPIGSTAIMTTRLNLVHREGED